MDPVKPRALQPGDTLAVVSPASPIKEEDLYKGLAHFEAQGYKIKLYPNVLAKDDYLAGTDAQRAADLQAAFDDPEVQGVLCSRGGYGCQRLFPYLDLDRIVASRKMFMGFSDITTLHVALQRRGLVTFHTPMAITLAYDREPWVHESVFALLRGDASTPTGAPAAETIVGGTAEGRTIGGCLCLLCDTIGTPEALETEGRILVIEDVDEAPHRVDAMFTHLINSGLLGQCSGIVVGEMTRTDEKRDPGIGGKGWKEIVIDRVKPLGIPSVVNYPFGHMKNMLSLPLGIRARLDADAGTLTFLESPCA